MSGSDLEQGKRKYISFTPNQPKGYPAGRKIYYECLECGSVVRSMPEYFDECQCGNIVVDSSGGRMSVEKPEFMKIFKLD